MSSCMMGMLPASAAKWSGLATSLNSSFTCAGPGGAQ